MDNRATRRGRSRAGQAVGVLLVSVGIYSWFAGYPPVGSVGIMSVGALSLALSQRRVKRVEAEIGSLVRVRADLAEGEPQAGEDEAA
jgi:hypothetical protein